jgi:hypothetical protein
LLLPPLKLLHLGLHLPLLAEKFMPPPEMQNDGHADCRDG